MRRQNVPVRRDHCAAFVRVFRIAFPIGSTAAISLSFGAAALLILLFGIWQIVRPTAFVLDAGGTQYTMLGFARHWRWEDVSGFRASRIGSGTAIVFDVLNGVRPGYTEIPALFSLPASEIVPMLVEARRHWIRRE